MTVVFIDPPGPLTNTFEPIDFTTERPVTSISVEFNPNTGSGSRETVFDGTDSTGLTGGDFAFMYKDSVRPVSGPAPYRWTIKRNARWPATFRIRVKEVTDPSAPSYPSAVLQPNLYNAVGMYALQGGNDPTPARLYQDRSGYGYHLTGGKTDTHPDLIVGQTCHYPPTFTANVDRIRRTTFTPAQQINGEVTVTLRCKRNPGGTGAFFIISGIYIGGTNTTRNTLISWGVGGDGTMSMFWEAGAGATNNVDRYSSVGLMPSGVWGFASFRRAANGVCTFGWNSTYSSASAAPLPIGGSEAFLNIGNSDETTNVPFGGDLADVCLWPARLTDAELTPLRIAALGI